MSAGWSARIDGPWMVVDHPLGQIHLLTGEPAVFDPGPLDVHLRRPDGRHLVATFASIADVERLMTAAFWAADLVIVRVLSVEAVVAAIEWMARENELEAAFAEAEPGDIYER